MTCVRAGGEPEDGQGRHSSTLPTEESVPSFHYRRWKDKCTHEQKIVRGLYCRSSYKGHAVDALASRAEEGRSKAAISLG